MLTLNKSCVERTHELLLGTRSKSGKFSFFNPRPGFLRRLGDRFGSLESEKIIIGSLESE